MNPTEHKESTVSPIKTTIIPVEHGSAVEAKLGCCVILLLFTLLVVFLPLFFLRCWRTPIVCAKLKQGNLGRLIRTHGLSFINCLAGGVFLGTALLHILVDAEEELMEGLHDAQSETEFPVANALVLAGIVLIMVIEQFATYLEERGRRFASNGERRSLILRGSIHSMSNGANDLETSAAREQVVFQSPLNSIILALAISIHSIFEGLAIGLQTSTASVFNLLFAVSIHKIVVTISLGLSLAQIESKIRIAIIFGVIYALAAPLGIVIGMLVASSSGGIAVGVLQSLACGTFIYVAAFEILPQELHNANRSRSICVLALIIGLVVVGLLNLFGPHAHEHGHH